MGSFLITIMADIHPAEFKLSELTITPIEVSIGEDVTISVIVINSGDLIGSYKAILKINDVVKETREITLAGSDNVTVSFSVTPDAAGKYVVNVNSLLRTFEIKTPEVPPVPLPAPAVVPVPASFVISDLSVTPSEVKPAQEVTISAVVTNTGGSEGSYTVVLKINGAEEAKKEVTVGAGKSETVAFTIARDTEGSYSVNIDGKGGQFTVIAPPPTAIPVEVLPVHPPTSWWLIGGIIAGGVVIVGLLVYFLVWRKAHLQQNGKRMTAVLNRIKSFGKRAKPKVKAEEAKPTAKSAEEEAPKR